MPDKAYGWHATPFGNPSEAMNLIACIQPVGEALRLQYDLAE
jgi:hypothetical protein